MQDLSENIGHDIAQNVSEYLAYDIVVQLFLENIGH